jgi:hypothetical protein
MEYNFMEMMYLEGMVVGGHSESVGDRISPVDPSIDGQ